MRAATVVTGLGVSLLLIGCYKASGGASRNVPGDTPRPGIPRPGQAGGAGGALTGKDAMRYVCRGAEGSGWIAVDYITDAEACAMSRSPNGTAVVVPLANTVTGGMLTVCADQPVPRDWHRVQLHPGDGRCPPRGTSSEAGPATVMTIQRNR